MTGDDELRERLQRLDPAPTGVPMHPYDGLRARQHLEQIMDTDTGTDTHTETEIAEEHTTATDGLLGGGPRRRWLGLGVAAAVAALVAGGIVLAGGDSSDEPTLALSAGSQDGSLASCLPVSAEALAEAPVAFAGTVASVEGDVATLEVDHWYRGGDAPTVEVTAVSGMEALIGELTFSPGDRYLVSAYDGTVNLCGFSGRATPELQEIYDQAFPS